MSSIFLVGWVCFGFPYTLTGRKQNQKETFLFIISWFLALRKKISNACTWAHTQTLTNAYVQNQCISGGLFFFNFLLFCKSIFKNNLDSQQQIVSNFQLSLRNWKSHQIHTCPLQARQWITCEAKLPYSSLSTRPETINSRFFCPVLSIMWKGEWGNNETNTNFL